MSPLEFSSPILPTDLTTVLIPNSVDLLPYTRHQSTKICLKAALNIAQTFNDLPFPNPTGELSMPPFYPTPASTLLAPRLMPSLACCAMQCTYTLFMVHSRMDSILLETGGANLMAENLLIRLRMGLSSVSTVFENYAVAFEALGGLRGLFLQTPEGLKANIYCGEQTKSAAYFESSNISSKFSGFCGCLSHVTNPLYPARHGRKVESRHRIAAATRLFKSSTGSS